MVLNKVTKFYKSLIKSIRLRERTSLDRRTYVRTYGRTGQTLNAPAIVMVGENQIFTLDSAVVEAQKVLS